MLTSGQTLSHYRILEKIGAGGMGEPKPLSALVPQAPLELERILTRALRKDPPRRFQTMADLKIALEDLRREVDSGVTITAKGRAARAEARPDLGSWPPGSRSLRSRGLTISDMEVRKRIRFRRRERCRSRAHRDTKETP